jgi:hypothetical protein
MINGSSFDVPTPQSLGKQNHIIERDISSAERLTILVNGDLRTEGVVIKRPNHSALDLNGLDIDLLLSASSSDRMAAASRKLLVIGQDFVAIHQMHPGRTPEIAYCGQATLAVASAVGRDDVAFDLAGPRGRRVRVTQCRLGSYTRQSWQLPDFPVDEAIWRGCVLAHCPALNDYIVIDGLPRGITPATARRELFDVDRLTNKLAIVTRRDGGPPHVAVETAVGTHSAIPASGVASIAALVRKSSWFANLLSSGQIAHSTGAGEIVIALPAVEDLDGSSLSISLPAADVVLSPLFEKF